MLADTQSPLLLHTRPGGAQDAPFLRALFDSHCAHLHALGLPPAALQALVDQQYAFRQADYGRRFPQARTVIALAGHEPIGALVLDDDDDDTLHIVDLAVAPHSRGCGHGRTLVQQVQAQAREMGRQAVTLSVNPLNQPALRLYLALGFEATEQQPVQWRMLWRPLPPAKRMKTHARNPRSFPP